MPMSKISQADFKAIFERNKISVFDEISLLHPKTMDNKDVLALSALKSMPKSERSNYEYPELLEKKWKVDVHNRTTFIHLYERYSECDMTERPAVLSKLNQFKSIIIRHEPYKSLRLKWEEYPFNLPLAPEEASEW